MGVYALLDGGWDGPVSWRKPIEFGISGGLTALSLAAVMSRLPRTGWLAWPCAVLVSLFVPETLLIDLQRWRGVPSHFNYATAFDSTVFIWMGVLVAFVSLGIFVMTVWAAVSLRGPTSSRVAIVAGLVFLSIGQLLGFAIVMNGTSSGHEPFNASIFGAAGEMKLPHAVALHALQLIGVLALVLERTALAESARLRLVLVATAGYTVALAVTAVQTFSGRAPLDLTVLTLAGGAVAALAIALAYAAALRGARSAASVGGLSGN